MYSGEYVPWIPEPSRRFNLLFTVEGSGIQGSEYHDGQVNVLSCLPDWASCLATRSWASLSLCFHCRIIFL
jgi:hypothetical protein